MENYFFGFVENNIIYGCKDYLSNQKQEEKADEFIIGFYKHNSLQEMIDLLHKIDWEDVAHYRRENNGFMFLILLWKNSVEVYAYHHKKLKEKISGNKDIELYDPLHFVEKNGEMVPTFKNYGEVYREYQFEKTYLLDLDRDVLTIRSKNEEIVLDRANLK